MARVKKALWAAAAIALTLVGTNAVSAGKVRPLPEFEPRHDDIPLSTAAKAGEFLFLAGQVGKKPTDGQPDEIEPEARWAMDQIGLTLKRHGLGYENIVKCTVFLADMQDWPRFNAVYATYFQPGKYPARSAMGVNGLSGGVKVEVECIAWTGRR